MKNFHGSALFALGIVAFATWTVQAAPPRLIRPNSVPITPAMQQSRIRPPNFATRPAGAILSPTVSAFQLHQLNHLGNELLRAQIYGSMFGYGYGGYGSYGGYGGYGGGYPMMSSPYGSSGTSVYYTSPYASSSSVPLRQSAASSAPLQQSAASASSMLTALGVTNESGQPTWPLGLQVLFPQKENLELLQQIKALLASAADQKLTGQKNSDLVQQGQRAVDRLHGAAARSRHGTAVARLPRIRAIPRQAARRVQRAGVPRLKSAPLSPRTAVRGLWPTIIFLPSPKKSSFSWQTFAAILGLSCGASKLQATVLLSRTRPRRSTPSPERPFLAIDGNPIARARRLPP